MIELDKLVEGFSSVGVPFYNLGEVANFLNGKAHESSIDEDGQYIVVNSKFISTEGKVKKYTNFQLCPVYKDDILIVMSDLPNGRALAKCFFVDENDRYSLNQRVGSINVKDYSKLSSRFLYYMLNRNRQLLVYDNGVDQTNLKKDQILEIRIPIPPLSIQNEIVRILDNFLELTAELTAELATRKKQYEYYLNDFFGIDISEMIEKCTSNSIDIHALEEIGTFTRGKRFVRDDIKETGIPCIHYGDLYTYYGISANETKCFLDFELSKKMRFASKGDVVIVQAGENDMDIGIGVAWLGDLDVAIHDACYIYKHNINSKYISYYLRSNVYHMQIKKYVSIGKICSISSQGIGKALIPVPSLEQQQRIVDILDKFDKLVNDISEGLPAEIAARQKQYEYYREKLLTFKEVGNESI